MNNDIERVLYSEEMLGKRMDELATDLTKDYKDKRPIIISVLSGAVLFTVDMIERLDIMAQIDFIDVSSYFSLSLVWVSFIWISSLTVSFVNSR